MLLLMMMMRMEMVNGPADDGEVKVLLESGVATSYINKSHLLVRGVPWL